jgi:hypothetical protein
MKRLLLLALGGLAFWVVVALPARALADSSEQAEQAVAFSGVAVLLCLVPAALTLLWAAWALKQSPEQQLVAVMGGTGVRLFVVLLAAWVLTRTAPYFREHGFWLWLAAAYCATLALEIALLLVGRVPAQPNQPNIG